MKTRNRRLAGLLCALLLEFVVASSAFGDAIYSNLGPGDTFIINRGYDTNFDFMATPFVTTGEGNLDDILTPIFSLDSPVTFGLYTSSGGRPGTPLESWNSSVPGFPARMVTLASVLNPFLSAATQYWFVVTVTDVQHNRLAWYQNDQAIDGGVWVGFNLNALLQAEPGSPAPAIRLNSTSSVREPGSGALAGYLALMLIVLRGTSRRRTVRS